MFLMVLFGIKLQAEGTFHQGYMDTVNNLNPEIQIFNSGQIFSQINLINGINNLVLV